MTEKDLFRTTLVTLAATLAAPLIIGLTGLGAPNGGSANDLVKSYVTAAQPNASDSSNQQTSNNGSDNGTNAGANQEQQATDQANTSSDTTQNGTGQSSQAVSASTADAKSAGVYTVKAGDTYGCIAEKYYGSYDQWQRVYDVNAGYPGYNEYDLAVGASLQMPAVSADQALPKTSVCS